MNDRSLELKSFMQDYSYRVVGPVMYEYTRWVISEAQKKGIKRLYFLARDGYLLCDIAKMICERNGCDIECRYFYCSRQSLRMPTYRFIGEEAFDMLCIRGYYNTPKSVLQRAKIDDITAREIYSELNIKNEDECFNKPEFEDFCRKLRACATYREAVILNSERAYAPAVKYFEQERIFENDTVAIVDSGWTGSMQRSMRQILDTCGFKGKICGFYFGMFEKPKYARDGEYLTYYFSRDNGIKRRVKFNNNLFECMLSAPHEMTEGYAIEDGIARPVFAKSAYSPELTELIKAQIYGALSYASEQREGEFDIKASLKKCYKILKKAMIYPTEYEAKMYSHFVFCDDVTEGYHMSLSEQNARRMLGSYMIFSRIIGKIFKRKNKKQPELFWPEGVIASCPAILRPWYRMNVGLWNWLKAILKKK